jgi:membrane protein implicated in regulation of membrane protease activity
MNWNWLLVIGGALMVLAEVLLGGFAGFDLVLVGTAFVLGGGIGFAMGNPVIGLIASSVLCILYIVAGRRWVRSRIHIRPVPSGADALIGLQGVVMRRIDAHDPGQIRVRDEQWRARPAPGTGPFEEGALVTVQSVDGVTLLVR